MGVVTIEYEQRKLEESALLKLKELFRTCKVVMVDEQECKGDVEGNSYTLFNIKFARNGKVGDNGTELDTQH